MRYQRYTGNPQLLEEDEAPYIIFIHTLTDQEVTLLLESYHPGEGQPHWNTT